MRHRCWRGTIMVACWLALPARTGLGNEGNTAPNARSLTLEQARAAATRAPRHRVAVAHRDVALAEVAAAGAWPATSLGVSSSHRTAHVGVVTSLPLPVFGTLAARKRTARAELEVAAAETVGVDLQLRREVTRAWLELARAQARSALSEDMAARQKELAAVTRARFDAGDAAHLDVVTADAESRRAEARVHGNRLAISAASAELAAVLGWDASLPLRARGQLPPLPELGPLADLRGARAAHPDARAAVARVDAENARITQACRERWPALSLDLEAMVDDPTLPGSDYRVGVTLELPLFGHTGAVQQAAVARRDAAAVERDQQLAALDGVLVAAYQRYQAARAHVLALDTDVLPASHEAARLARAAYREGQVGLVDVLAAERAITDSESERLDARADAALALADLEWATAEELL